MTPDTGSGPPAEGGRNVEQPFHQQAADGVSERTGDERQSPEEQGTDPLHLDLTACTRAEFFGFLAGYRAGIWRGTAEAIAKREAEDRAVYQMAVKVVHAAADWPEQPAHRQVPMRWTDGRWSL